MKVNQLKAGAILSYFTMGIGFLVSIVYTPIMLRLLGQSEYGLYNLVASVVSYLGVLNFGFGSAYMRYYSRYKVQEDKEKIATLNGMFLIIFSILGVIAVIAGLILAMNTEIVFGSKLTTAELDRSKTLMIILVINLAISFPNIVFNSHIIANERFVFQKFLLMIKVIINPFVVLPILLLGYGSVGMVIVTTVLNIFTEITNIIYCRKKLKMIFSFNHFDFKLMREMTIFSSFIFINLLVDQIYWNIDKYILGRFHGTVTVAVYGLAAQLTRYYIYIAGVIAGVFIPRVHKLVTKCNNNSEIINLFTKVGRIQFIILSLIGSGFIFFGRSFINMWAGEKYDGSYLIVLLLIIPVTIPLIQNIGIEIQRAKNMHKFRSWVYLFIALVNLGLTIPLVKMYGGIGAAAGTSVALLIGNGIIMNWYYHVKMGLDMKCFWKQIISFIPALILPILAGITMINFFDLFNIINFLVCGCIYVIVFSFSMWFLGANKFEKELIKKPILKLVGKMHK